MTEKTITFEIICETSAAMDAADELVALHQRVCGGHGEVFRDLQRRIESYAEGIITRGVDPGDTPIRRIDNFMMAEAPRAMTALIVEARKLLGDTK